MHKALHTRADIDREEEIGLAIIKDSVNASIWGVEDYIKNNKKKTYYNE